MKIVIIGGSGLIGSKLVARLREDGHEAVPASPDSGVNTLTGEGLAEVLAGAAVVIDVSNSPSFDDAAVLKFFETSTGNLPAAEAAAGVGHPSRCQSPERRRPTAATCAPRSPREADRSSSIPSRASAPRSSSVLKRADEATTEHGAHRPRAFQPSRRRRRDVVGRSQCRLGNGIVEIAGQKSALEFSTGLGARHDPVSDRRPASSILRRGLDGGRWCPGGDASWRDRSRNGSTILTKAEPADHPGRRPGNHGQTRQAQQSDFPRLPPGSSHRLCVFATRGGRSEEGDWQTGSSARRDRTPFGNARSKAPGTPCGDTARGLEVKYRQNTWALSDNVRIT